MSRANAEEAVSIWRLPMMNYPSHLDYVYVSSNLYITRIKATVMESIVPWVVDFELMVVDVMEIAAVAL